MSHLGPFIAVLQYGFAVRLQLTQLSSSGVASINYSYNFPTGTNNGKIGSSYNALSGETIAYQYDSLNRLISAAGSGWGDAYGFDGFGNLLSKTVTSGSAPTLSQAVNSANNQIVGQGYDANGNQTSPPNNSGELIYDAENRLTQNSVSIQYAYDSQNKRVWVGTLVSGSLTSQSANLYGIDGQKLGAYSLSVSSSGITDTATSLSVYFGHKRVGIVSGGGTLAFVQDRLGSNMSWAIDRVSLYPWGEDRGTPAPNDQIKFATYTRDSATQLDYADQRYYSNVGRFMSPDPAGANAASPRKPASWNRYAYAGGDPVNRNDPTGLSSCALDDPLCNPFGFDSDDDDDDDGGETINYPCYAPNGFEPMPSPGCQGGGPPQPKQPSSPVASCSISLWQRPAPTSNGPGWHTYISVTETYGSSPAVTDFEGGPQGGLLGIGGTLTGTIAAPGAGLRGISTGPGNSDATGPGLQFNYEVGKTYSGSNACADFAKLLSLVTAYNDGSKVTYSFLAVGGYNSNSFTYTLLTQLGLSSYFGPPGGPQPGGAFLVLPGWNKTVPGL
jgi:RHS repeat-associated protein